MILEELGEDRLETTEGTEVNERNKELELFNWVLPMEERHKN